MLVAQGDLTDVDILEVRRTWWKSTHSLALSYPILGGIDVSLNESAGSKAGGWFQVHYAFAIFGHDDSDEARHQLEGDLGSVVKTEPTADRPIYSQPIRNPMEQLSYLNKSRFSKRLSIIDNRDQKNTLYFDLQADPTAEISAWLDRYTFTDRLLLQNLRRVGDRLRPSAWKNDNESKKGS